MNNIMMRLHLLLEISCTQPYPCTSLRPVWLFLSDFLYMYPFLDQVTFWFNSIVTPIDNMKTMLTSHKNHLSFSPASTKYRFKNQVILGLCLIEINRNQLTTGKIKTSVFQTTWASPQPQQWQSFSPPQIQPGQCGADRQTFKVVLKKTSKSTFTFNRLVCCSFYNTAPPIQPRGSRRHQHQITISWST